MFGRLTSCKDRTYRFSRPETLGDIERTFRYVFDIPVESSRPRLSPELFQ